MSDIYNAGRRGGPPPPAPPPRHRPPGRTRPFKPVTADLEAALRVTYTRWTQLRAELADAREELAVAIRAAHDPGGLSYRQIGRTLDRDAMFAHRVTREGRHRQ